MFNLSTDQSLPCIYYEVFSYATYIILDQILLLKRVTAPPKLLAYVTASFKKGTY